MAPRPAPPGNVWVDDRLVVLGSAIEGRGLFFVEDLPAGTVVIGFGGRLVTSAELDSLIATVEADPTTPYVDTITLYEDAHFVLPPDTPVHFGNHSCDPTLWYVAPYHLAVRRDVLAGEEATIDYATVSGAAGLVMTCLCGAPTCRLRVTNDDRRLPELQNRYRDHWVPALQARIDAH